MVSTSSYEGQLEMTYSAFLDAIRKKKERAPLKIIKRWSADMRWSMEEDVAYVEEGLESSDQLHNYL